MKLISLLTLAGLATAELSLYERQVQTIATVVTQVRDATSNLDNAVRSFNGPQNIPQLQQAGQQLQQTVQQGTVTIMSATSISLNDAVQLQQGAQGLQSSVESVVRSMINKRDTILAAGAGAWAVQFLTQMQQNAQGLSTALVSKVPQAVQGPAQQLSVGINTALQKGVNAFGGSQNLVAVVTNINGFPVTTTVPGPATFTGAASPLHVAKNLAGVAVVVAIAL